MISNFYFALKKEMKVSKGQSVKVLDNYYRCNYYKQPVQNDTVNIISPIITLKYYRYRTVQYCNTNSPFIFHVHRILRLNVTFDSFETREVFRTCNFFNS